MNQVRRKILIVEDEPDIARGLSDAFVFEGFETFVVTRGRDGVRALRERAPDLVILDLMLPDANGFQICEDMRRCNPVVPIIMLTARSQENDKIRGLDAGADDYVCKPFSIGELLARVNAMFRRMHRATTADDEITIGSARVFLRRQELQRKRKTWPLSFYEVELLRLLVERAGQPVAREEILEKIWGTSGHAGNRSVDNTVVKLRKKLEPDPARPRHIVTIYGTGYKLVE